MATTTLSPIDAGAAQVQIARSLGFDEKPDRPTFIAELVRAVVWALTAGQRPVHVSRLVNHAVERQIELADVADSNDASARDQIHGVLEALADAGDLVELDGGLWLPAVSRLVPLGDTKGFLLVGGIPTRMLAIEVATSVNQRGAFRRLNPGTLKASISLPYEALDSWARFPSETLDDWASELTRVQLPEYEEARDTAIELYRPDLAKRGTPQFKRWYANVKSVDGRYLARRSRVYGAREYRLVEVSNGRIRRMGAVFVPGEARRLMYALDARSGNSTVARWTSKQSSAEFVTNSELPQSEQRFFAALGTLHVTDRVYERRWTFSSDSDLVLNRLRNLKIDVQVAH